MNTHCMFYSLFLHSQNMQLLCSHCADQSTCRDVNFHTEHKTLSFSIDNSNKMAVSSKMLAKRENPC